MLQTGGLSPKTLNTNSPSNFIKIASAKSDFLNQMKLTGYKLTPQVFSFAEYDWDKKVEAEPGISTEVLNKKSSTYLGQK